MVRFTTTWRRRSNSNSRIVDKALGNTSVSHIVASGSSPTTGQFYDLPTSRPSGSRDAAELAKGGLLHQNELL